MNNRAIWKVRRINSDYWFATKKEAEAFIAGSAPQGCELERIAIGNYMDPKQTVDFIRQNFGSVYHDYGAAK